MVVRADCFGGGRFRRNEGMRQSASAGGLQKWIALGLGLLREDGVNTQGELSQNMHELSSEICELSMNIP